MLKSKRLWFYVPLMGILCLLLATTLKPECRDVFFPVCKPDPEPKIKLTRITDTRVVTGKVESYRLNSEGLELKLKCKDDTYTLLVTSKSDIVSHFPRVEHTPSTMNDYITKNPDCNCMVGVHKGVVTNVIVHPPETHDQQSQPSPE